MILKRLAVFKNVELDYVCCGEKGLDYTDSPFIRLTEYLECRFNDLPIENQIKNELELLTNMEDAIKRKALVGFANIEKRKGELLALTHEVKS
jgi:hypothetical protein